VRLVKTEWWGAGVVICLKRGADLHMAQLIPLPLTVSCVSKIQTGFIFLVPAHPGSPGKRAVRWCMLLYFCYGPITFAIRARFEYDSSTIRARFGYEMLRDAYDSSAILARYNIVRGVMCFRAIMNMSVLLRCCRML